MRNPGGQHFANSLLYKQSYFANSPLYKQSYFANSPFYKSALLLTLSWSPEFIFFISSMLWTFGDQNRKSILVCLLTILVTGIAFENFAQQQKWEFLHENILGHLSNLLAGLKQQYIVISEIKLFCIWQTIKILFNERTTVIRYNKQYPT